MCCKRVIIISLTTSFFSILSKVLYCDVPFHTIKEEFFASFPGLLHIRLCIFMYLCYCINLQESRWEHTPHAVKVSSSIQIQELSLGKCNSWKTLISFQDLQHVSFNIESSAMLSKKKNCVSPHYPFSFSFSLSTISFFHLTKFLDSLPLFLKNQNDPNPSLKKKAGIMLPLY